MPKSVWGATIVVFGYLAICALLARLLTLQDQDPAPHHEWDGPHHNQQNSQQTTEDPTLIEADKPPPNSDKTYTVKQQHDGLDYWTFVVGLVTLFILLVYTCINYGLYKTTSQQFGLSERPWIAGDFHLRLTGIDKAGGGIGGTISSHLENFGHLVGVNVQPLCLPDTLDASKGDTIRGVANEVCQQLSWAKTQNSGWSMLFPNETMTRELPIHISFDDLGKPGLNPLIICCIDYRLPFERGHHQTRRTFFLGVPQPAPSVGWNPVTVDNMANAALLETFDGNEAN
jgi:hypothetical protein